MFCRIATLQKVLPCLILLLFCGIPLQSPAQEAPAAAPSIPETIDLQDGDTLVFLGDSITHQRLYTQYVEDFFYTRFPSRRITFHNAGIGGARAWDALQRVSRDVLAYKPRYVTILLGMNDGSYRPFDAGVFETYSSDMTQLIAKIKEGGAKPILMSPTMFDARAAKVRGRWDEAMLSQYNGVLAYYGKWLQHQAIEGGYSYVDMFGLLNAQTVLQRKTDPAFTLIKDAIHPDAPGQLLMASAVIDDLGLRKPLSNIRIVAGAQGNLRSSATGGKLTDVQKTENGVEFKWTAESLPWVFPEDAQPGARLIGLGHRASRESLTVAGLAPGSYELSIDDVVVGKWNHVSLAGHIELQQNSKTPQYQQAMKVVLLNKKKNEGPVKQMRDAWLNFQGWARQSRQLAEQPENQQLAEQVAAGKAKVDMLEEVIKKSETEAKAIEDEIYTANQPATRQFRLVRIAP